MEIQDNRLLFVNIGIGINVNNDPADKEPKSPSLKKISGRDISGKAILSAFLDEFEARIHAGLDHVISEWKQYAITLNRHVKIVTTQEELEGIATDVDEHGALILKLADGSIKLVIYGDCFFIKECKVYLHGTLILKLADGSIKPGRR